jgi:REP element-mobilizing transposase RayT
MLPHRARPVHPEPVEQRNRSIIIFLTVCTKDRRPVLSNSSMHACLRNTWANATHWLVGRYVVMPDHVHLFCAPGALPVKPLSGWVRYWKATVSKAAGAAEGTFWQTDFWDTQLRQHESYDTKWGYVANNPVRIGLVPRTEVWPYQGELNLLRWHD